MTSGLPSGLRVTDWNIAPETANAAPAAAPTSSRGRRLVHSTHSCARDPVPATTPGSSASGMPSCPAESVDQHRDQHDHQRDDADDDRPAPPAHGTTGAEPRVRTRASQAHPPSAHGHDQERRPDERRHGTDGELAGPGDDPADDVGGEQQDRPEHEAVRQAASGGRSR